MDIPADWHLALVIGDEGTNTAHLGIFSCRNGRAERVLGRDVNDATGCAFDVDARSMHGARSMPVGRRIFCKRYALTFLALVLSCPDICVLASLPPAPSSCAPFAYSAWERVDGVQGQPILCFRGRIEMFRSC